MCFTCRLLYRLSQLSAQYKRVQYSFPRPRIIGLQVEGSASRTFEYLFDALARESRAFIERVRPNLIRNFLTLRVNQPVDSIVEGNRTEINGGCKVR